MPQSDMDLLADDFPPDDIEADVPEEEEVEAPNVTVNFKVFLEDRSFDPPVAIHMDMNGPASETITMFQVIRQYAKVNGYVGHVGFGVRPVQAQPAAATPAAAAAPPQEKHFCSKCGAESTWRQGVSQSTGKQYSGWFCTADNKHIDWGKGK